MIIVGLFCLILILAYVIIEFISIYQWIFSNDDIRDDSDGNEFL